LLSDEPYWERLRELLQWAQANTTSSIWSCLAAHAAVELLDGIRRRRLEQKRCGVFAHDTLPDQPLLKGISTPLHTPHSRWNELPVDALRDAGYSIVSASAASGADMFTKQAGSLLVFFQGHPEYEDTTLLREYRRDVGRYLRGQQARLFPAGGARAARCFRGSSTGGTHSGIAGGLSNDLDRRYPAEHLERGGDGNLP
jgi:homoserine O-succinyltransferase